MSRSDGTNDRAHWNERYADADSTGNPPPFLSQMLTHLPTVGTALEVAGGSGAGACALAQHGLDVTLTDVSDVALEQAAERARRLGVQVHTVQRDLEGDGLPTGDWDVITCLHYLHRPLITAMVNALKPSGLLALAIATVTNLERNPRPRPPYLLEPGELTALVEGLEIVSFSKGWTDSGHHEAQLLARRV